MNSIENRSETQAFAFLLYMRNPKSIKIVSEKNQKQKVIIEMCLAEGMQINYIQCTRTE